MFCWAASGGVWGTAASIVAAGMFGCAQLAGWAGGALDGPGKFAADDSPGNPVAIAPGPFPAPAPDRVGGASDPPCAAADWAAVCTGG